MKVAVTVGSTIVTILLSCSVSTQAFVAPGLSSLLSRSSSSSTVSNNIKNLEYCNNDPHTKSSSCLSMNILSDLIGGDEAVTKRTEEERQAENDAYIKELQKRVDRINSLEETIEELDDDELIAKTAEFRQRLKDGEDINGPLLEEAFAVVREASWRVLELRHYDVQLLGGLILHDGRLAEMATGEGKTLVSTLPCYVNALDGEASYVITVNDYLARRDMEKMGQIHKFLGLSVGLIQSNMNEEQRREQYSKDIVYVTNSELGFDYLRDHLALSPAQTVIPGGGGEFNGFCVVDEADSVLIDEARTPLIISKQVPAPSARYDTANKIANALKKDVHYTVDEKNKNCILNEQGYRDSENALGIKSLFEVDKASGEAWVPYITNAIKAKELFEKDVEYTILTDKDGNKNGVGIIDSFTGRVLDGRRWSDGLHQSIEAKEQIPVSEQSQVIAKVTYQNLFRQFKRLSGMTGTAMTDAGEFEIIYDLKVAQVPTALPIARRDYPDVAFKTRLGANEALINEVIKVGGGKDDGRPCLIGTTSVQQSEVLVDALKEKGINAELLNASPKNAPRESEIIAQAGRCGIVTVATNMAGRGTDILLGGCPTTMARIKTRGVLVDAGVIKDEEEKSTIPPTPEESYFPCPISDDTMTMLKDAAASIKATKPDLDAITLDEILTVATDTTESDEDPDYIIKLRDAAEAVKETYKPICSEEKDRVLEMGGLYVMGTNRHESSRIDNQLRGRAGRQGDPGTSRFFLSFQDDMFVIFGGDTLSNMLKMFRVSDDMPVEAPQIQDAMDKVQRAVEEKYREIRGEIFKFDENLNNQRKVIYDKRRNVLFADTPQKTVDIIAEYNEKTVDAIVKAQTNDDSGVVDAKKVVEKIIQFFPPVKPVLQLDDIAGQNEETTKQIINVVVDEVFKSILKERSIESVARSANYITLVSMDNAWSSHLQSMESLKESVLLLDYQGLNPVDEYRRQAFELFEGLEETIRFNTVYSLWVSLATPPAPKK